VVSAAVSVDADEPQAVSVPTASAAVNNVAINFFFIIFSSFYLSKRVMPC
jgi:hypothetical protein